jgi:hypothetical protein
MVLLLDLSFPIPIHIYIIFLCVLISLISLTQKQPPSYMWLFTFYMILTLLVEFIGWWSNIHNKNNLPLYNIYGVINIIYSIYLVRHFLQEGKAKKMFGRCMLIYPVFPLINIGLIQRSLHSFATYSYIIGAVMIVICCICYFYQRIKYPGKDNLLRDPSFWIATGLLFFNSISVPNLGIINFLTNIPKLAYKTFFNISVVINIILYSLYCISSLCSLNFRKLSS